MLSVHPIEEEGKRLKKGDRSRTKQRQKQKECFVSKTLFVLATWLKHLRLVRATTPTEVDVIGVGSYAINGVLTTQLVK